MHVNGRNTEEISVGTAKTYQKEQKEQNIIFY